MVGWGGMGVGVGVLGGGGLQLGGGGWGGSRGGGGGGGGGQIRTSYGAMGWDNEWKGLITPGSLMILPSSCSSKKALTTVFNFAFDSISPIFMTPRWYTTSLDLLRSIRIDREFPKGAPSPL